MKKYTRVLISISLLLFIASCGGNSENGSNESSEDTVQVADTHEAVAAEQTTGLNPSATVFFLRHAEKASEGKDPSLTEEGQARARNLIEVLNGASIHAIYSTPYNRTRETVAPLAESLGLEIMEYHPGDTTFINKLKSLSADSVVVVSGHSNTTPFLVNEMAGTDYEMLDESDYGKLFKVHMNGDEKTVTMLNF